jgi:hypothetical protein
MLPVTNDYGDSTNNKKRNIKRPRSSSNESSVHESRYKKTYDKKNITDSPEISKESFSNVSLFENTESESSRTDSLDSERNPSSLDNTVLNMSKKSSRKQLYKMIRKVLQKDQKNSDVVRSL